MAIRLRTVNGVLVAICAARSMAKPGDVYLDDTTHYALAQKFRHDYGLDDPFLPETEIRDREESNNPAREWWERTYGGAIEPEPVTVRTWFRKMRAADFARDLEVAVARSGVGGIDCLTGPDVQVGNAPLRWTLFDVRRLVDRETAAKDFRALTHGEWPTIEMLPRTPGDDEPISASPWRSPWFIKPVIEPMPLPGTLPQDGYVWLGIDRSLYPLFSSKVPEARGVLGISLKDINRALDSRPKESE
jgi:hypothetical protein